jgi:hypothetical protein
MYNFWDKRLAKNGNYTYWINRLWLTEIKNSSLTQIWV